MCLGLFFMVRLTSQPVGAEIKEKGKKGGKKPLQRRWRNVCKTLAYIPPPIATIKKWKWCFIFSYFFLKRAIHLPQQPSPRQPKTFNQERINRNTTHNLLSGEEGAAAWLRTSQKYCSPRQKEVPSVATLMSLLSCQRIGYELAW